MAAGNATVQPTRSLWEMIRSHPTGFWFIFWGELAERCSYYGMMAILARYLSEKMDLGDGAANNWVSYFKAACYFLPLLGGFLADNYLGKYRLIIIFSIPYILGHVVLAVPEITYTIIALGLLAMGSGAIKPNISTLMGMTYDQKRPGDDQLRTMAFGMFYMAINIGAFVSYAMLPKLRDWFDYHWAFMFPAVLMGVSFLLFAIGKPFYAVETISKHVATPQEWAEKKLTLRRIAGVFLTITFFWAIFDQSHTTWIFFARDFTDLSLFGWRIAPDAVGAINPFLIVLFVPLLTVFWNQLAARGVIPRATDKIMIGFILTAVTMGIMSLAGYLVPKYEVRPALKGNDKDAPYILTTPDKVSEETREIFKKDDQLKVAPPMQNVQTVSLLWVIQNKTPEVTKEPGKATVVWGANEKDKVVLTWADHSVQPEVAIDSENRVTVSGPNSMTVTYEGEAKVSTKKVVDAKDKVSIWWEVLAFVALTLAEVLISVTGLELAFVVSPNSMKSFVTALWLLTVGIANLLINAQVGRFYEGWNPGVYFAFLTGLMVLVIGAFVFVALRFNILAAEQARIAAEAAAAARLAEGSAPPA